MAAHRQAFPTPRGDGKGDPKGGACRLLDIVAHRLWWIGTTAQRAPRRKPAGVVTMGVYPCRVVFKARFRKSGDKPWRPA